MTTSSDKEERARQTVEHFLQLYEPSYQDLLYYAALPLILTPELLHYLRHTFTPRTPWIAEVDILLAENLCRQYSTYEQYLMHADVRAWLLKQARAQPDFRLADAARVLLHYIDELQRIRPYKSRRELETQAWSAMVYIDDEHCRDVVERIKEAFRRAGERQPDDYTGLMSEAEMERLANIVTMLAPELGQHQGLVEYASYIHDLIRNEPKVDKRAYQRFLGEDMPSPAELTGKKGVRDQVFISYSHNDEAWKDRVVRQLRVLEHRGLLSLWEDRQLALGDDWLPAIETAIQSCRVALLLVSANFLASRFILDKEVSALLQRREQEGVRVLPVILKPCAWTQVSWLKTIQVYPKNGKPLSSMSKHDADAALTALMEEVAGLLQSPPIALPAISNIHGWSATQVQTLQQQTARALGVPVVFCDKFSDGSQGPEMVVIPAGEFLMGSPKDESERQNSEGPQHKVVIAKPFAMGRYAVTFEEYDRFCEATRCSKPSDADWGRGRRPVINVSWEDAAAYCVWLSKETGVTYRLPSEAEWEYAARAGTTTAFWWGDDIDTTRANYDGNYTYRNGPKGEYRQQTVPVDTFQPNPFGLYQVHGNVWEWVQDSWHENYDGAPVDGSAWIGKSGSPCVRRGGSWPLAPGGVRGAARLGSAPRAGVHDWGFRLARTFP